MAEEAVGIVEEIRTALEDPTCAGIRFAYEYEPVGGAGMPVTPPAGHLNEHVSKSDKTLKPLKDQPGLFLRPNGTTSNDAGGIEAKRTYPGVTLNTYGAQANRFEKALKNRAVELGYPLISVDGYFATSLDWPHRHADVHWRLLSQAFKDVAGEDAYDAIRLATPDQAGPLLKWFPASLLFGWWHSQAVPTDLEDKLRKAEDKLRKNEDNLREKESAVDAAQEMVNSNGNDASLRTALSKAKSARTAARNAVTRAETALSTAQLNASRQVLGHVEGEISNVDRARFGRVISSQILARDVIVQNRLAARLDPFGPFRSGTADIGLGTVPPQAGVRDVVAERIDGFTFLSFDVLRNIGFASSSTTKSGDSQVNTVGPGNLFDPGSAPNDNPLLERRLLLSLLGLIAILDVEDQGVVRSGCELRINKRSVQIIRHTPIGPDGFLGDCPLRLDREAVPVLVKAVRALGKRVGWASPVTLEPTEEYVAAAREAENYRADAEGDNGTEADAPSEGSNADHGGE